MFGYMAVGYSRYSASLFAMNEFARSTLAFAAILWAGPYIGFRRCEGDKLGVWFDGSVYFRYLFFAFVWVEAAEEKPICKVRVCRF